MLRTTVVLSALAWTVTGAIAAPGSYVGGGQDRTVNAGPTSYKGTLVVKEIDPQTCELTETYETSHASEPMTFVSTLRFRANGELVIEKRGVVVGGGKYWDLPEGRWANYSIASETGPLHVSAFYSHKDGAFLRTGDMILDGKVHYWADKFVKKAE